MNNTFNISSDVNETINYKVILVDTSEFSNDPDRAMGWTLEYQARNNKWVCYAQGCAATPEAAQDAADTAAIRHYRVYH